MSMEFLMGRALGNNLINMTAYKDVKEALEEMGIDLNVIEDQEPDAALGNGGLGRLAACFLDSLATLNYPAYGCGIRYRYGMFKQKIENGYQKEVPDDWLKEGNPFELRREEYAKEVRFGGNIRFEKDPVTGKDKFIQENYESVLAIPYDMPIVGYGNHVVNTPVSYTHLCLSRSTTTRLRIKNSLRNSSRQTLFQRPWTRQEAGSTLCWRSPH